MIFVKFLGLVRDGLRGFQTLDEYGTFLVFTEQCVYLKLPDALLERGVWQILNSSSMFLDKVKLGASGYNYNPGSCSIAGAR